ncbi:MAG: putative oxidoreductase [Pseudonocardiales bacterium]|nr:putative oxidoreductase [Pseudonocardiales bacterium]
MRAIEFSRLGPPEVLELVECDEPHAGPGQIRIATRAAGVNPVDWKIRSGASRRATPIPLPSVPGLEASGRVDEVGAGVIGIEPGDEVFGVAVSGGSAEFVVLAHWAVKPPAMSWAEAAGIPMAAETAARGLDTVGLREGAATGKTVLISGAAGGVGTAAVQFAVERGATVVGTGGPDSQEYIAALGAIPVVYGSGLVERVRGLMPGGVDLALDIAGHGVGPDLIALTGNADNVVSIGDFDSTALGIRFTSGAESRAYEALAEAATLFEQGRFTMPVARTFRLDELAEAHRISELGHVRGKLVVVF